MDAAELPVPPGGVRPGHLGVIASGRVVLGDIAATAVDLSLRGWLEIESSGGEDGGWVLAAAEPPQDGQDLVEYERVLLGWLARPSYPASLASLAADLPAGLAQVREEVVRDAVHQGWLRRLHHHERTRAGEELAGQLRAFRQELRSARVERGPQALDGELLPYALHFGLAAPGHRLARFAHAWVATFAEFPEWRAPARWRTATNSEHDASIGAAARERTLDEDIMSHDVGAMLWVTGW
ncbi:MAG: hypothetical protein ABSB59_33680 [Streptosporangiaceae bacterium]